jgi:hypothetical protein
MPAIGGLLAERMGLEVIAALGTLLAAALIALHECLLALSTRRQSIAIT